MRSSARFPQLGGGVGEGWVGTDSKIPLAAGVVLAELRQRDTSTRKTQQGATYVCYRNTPDQSHPQPRRPGRPRFHN